MGDELVFYVNGKRVTESTPDARETLVQFLRRKVKLTGTKQSCGIGACGACTVMVSDVDPNNQIRHCAVNACLLPICYLHGKAVTTVEGIGSIRTNLHEVQEKLVEANGTQCGFCTPGMVMSMFTLLKNQPTPSLDNIQDALKGNLCRCTGYRPILEGFSSFTPEGCGLGKDCCQVKKTEAPSKKADPEMTQELIFPNELQLNRSSFISSVTFISDHSVWYQPATLSELLTLKANNPNAKLVTGCTAMGSAIRVSGPDQQTIISAANIDELQEITWDRDGVTFGGSVTLTMLQEALRAGTLNNEEDSSRGMQAIVGILNLVGSRQLKNSASIGGHVALRSTASDLNILLVANKVNISCSSASGGTRSIELDSDFFDPNNTPLNPDEVIVSVSIPFLPKQYTTKVNSQEWHFMDYFSSCPVENSAKAETYVMGYKEPSNGHATVNAGLRVTFEKGSNVVLDAILVFGGTALGKTFIASRTSSSLVGSFWDENLLQATIPALEEELFGSESAVPTHDRILVSTTFFKFYVYVLTQLDNECACDPVSVKKIQKISARGHLKAEPPKSVKVTRPHAKDGENIVGQSVPHVTSRQQATGEALYVNDIPHDEDELFMVFILSTKPHAKIISVDTTAALAMPGVVDYIDHTDVPGDNTTGYYIVQDEEVFASTEVNHVGTIIGGILATSEQEARDAAEAVIVNYEELPFILTIEEAIAANSFYDYDHSNKLGDAEGEMSNCDFVVEGTVNIGGQLQFYAEPNVCLVKPGEDNEMEIFCPNHSLIDLQNVTAKALGLPKNKLYMKTKRIGGSFGGKDSNSRRLVPPVAVAAYKHQKPVRCVFSRSDDTTIIGGRHPMMARYRLGFMSDGKMKTLIADIYSNAGSSMDNSLYVMDWALLQGDGAYYIPNVLIRGHLCKTNTRSPASFRGYGGPQGTFIYKTLINHAARTVKKPLEQVQSLNFYIDGNLSPYHQTMTDMTYLHQCWEQLKEKACFTQRLSAVEVFNRSSRIRKRGIALEPVKFGIGGGVAFLVQGAALVNVYTDGSVLLAHAGIEMGQGLNTKMIQVASQVLDIPIDRIYTNENNTAAVPNPLPTIASFGSDINGVAVKEACETILERLRPFKEANPNGSWEEWVSEAFYSRTNLSATGYGRIPGIYDFDWSNPADNPPFIYFTSGAMCAEVEVDLLNGAHVVRRIDIVMDVGKSLNPAIDIGQIEGGFVQGMGWHTYEEVKWSPDGALASTNFDDYHIPTFADIPSEFNVTLLNDSNNPRTVVYSSKGIGEPPLFGGSSVLFAIQEALYAALRDAGHPEDPFILDTPVTAVKIRQLCIDKGITPSMK